MLAPVPPLSADARAKLEQALKARINELESEGGTFASCGGHEGMRYQYDMEFAAALNELRRLLALPPHEGETPQPDGINADGASNSAPNLRTPQPDPRLSLSQQTQAKAIADHYGVWEREKNELVILNALRALAHRAALEGETPQPAAEPSGWREAMPKEEPGIWIPAIWDEQQRKWLPPDVAQIRASIQENAQIPSGWRDWQNLVTEVLASLGLDKPITLADLQRRLRVDAPTGMRLLSLREAIRSAPMPPVVQTRPED